MKILKLLFIVLVPALAVVSCQKSDIKPRNCQDHEDSTPAVVSKMANSNSTQSEDNSSGQNSDYNAKTSTNGTVVDTKGSTETTEIIGSGDDDRDGGDKKKKLVK